jgi:hypothetical protein
MGRTRDVSKILTSNTSILTLASASTTYQTKASNALVLLNTTSFTTQSTASINNVFSATYTHYKIVTDFIHSGAGTGVAIRLRVSGSDDSSTNYRQQRLSISSTTVSAERTTSNTSWIDAAVAYSNQKNLNTFEIANPFEANTTTCYNFRGQDGLSSTQFSILYYAFIATTSFTGFSLIADNGTLTGSVSVYGYNK